MEPIAVRKLSSGDDEIVVTIGKPELFEDGNDYQCPYTIDYLNKVKCGHASGVDAVQAIQLAMISIGAELKFLSTKYDNPISWFKDVLGDTGFPNS